MNKKLLFSVTVMFSGLMFSQKNYWKQVSAVDSRISVYDKTAIPKNYKLYKLEIEGIKADLAKAPKRFSKDESLVLKFPTSEGRFVDYVVQEASVMDPALQAKYPDIRSYIGYEKGHNGNSIRFSISPYDGINVMYFDEGKTAYLDAYTTDHSTYMVFDRKDLPAPTNQFVCGYKDIDVPEAPAPNEQSIVQDGQFRNYRLALSSTMEYSRYHINRAGLSGGTIAQKKAAVLAAMNTTMTRVNGVYEKTVSLTLVMIPNNDLLLSIDVDAYGPGFTNDNGKLLLNENQAFVDQTVGNNAYDIGHIFSTGGGGIAQRPSVCASYGKARGVTGSTAPRNDAFDIDYVAHEIGHQFGGNHTFRSNAGNCADPNGNTPTAVEPGSGTTIMAYAGICSPDNVQNRSDAYFHSVSVAEIYNTITTTNCANKTSNNNAAPTANAGSDYTIPYGTAFVLTGTGNDPDGDSLTYLWEQIDAAALSATNPQPPVSTAKNGTIFRSYFPSTSPMRYFPAMSSISENNLSPTWEVIPTVARTLNFSLLVNDNKATGNQSARDLMVVTVANTGPFTVTSQTSAANYDGGTPINVTWNVAGTNASPINTQNVQILLSSDNGLTYPTVIGDNLPNNGSASVILPNEDNSSARIMVKAANNIYFAVNTTRFNIVKKLAVNESAFEKGFAIYPNPAKGEVNILLNQSSKDASYQIVDLSGKLISTGKLENAKNQINISSLKTGTYRIIISNNGEKTNKNLVVK